MSLYRVSTNDWYRVLKKKYLKYQTKSNSDFNLCNVLLDMSAIFSINFTKKLLFVPVCYNIIEKSENPVFHFQRNGITPQSIFKTTANRLLSNITQPEQ